MFKIKMMLLAIIIILSINAQNKISIWVDSSSAIFTTIDSLNDEAKNYHLPVLQRLQSQLKLFELAISACPEEYKSLAARKWVQTRNRIARYKAEMRKLNTYKKFNK